MKVEYLRIGYAYLWLIGMIAMGLCFGFGHIEEKTSYGLMPIVVSLAAVGPKWPLWAERPKEKPDGPS